MRELKKFEMLFGTIFRGSFRRAEKRPDWGFGRQGPQRICRYIIFELYTALKMAFVKDAYCDLAKHVQEAKDKWLTT